MTILQFARFFGYLSGVGSFFLATTNALAQSATDSASKGGTSGALPDAGSTELTYVIFIGGVILFVFGTLKLILSYRGSE